MRGLLWGWHGSVVWVDGIRPGAAQGWRLREVPTNSRLPGMSRTAWTGWVGLEVRSGGLDGLTRPSRSMSVFLLVEGDLWRMELEPGWR